MRTAQEMYQYCKTYNFGRIKEKSALKSFALIESSLAPDEKAIMSFAGIHTMGFAGKDMSKLSSGTNIEYVYAVTEKRIFIAQKSMINEVVQTVMIDRINDITFAAGLMTSAITISTLNETFQVGSYDKKQSSAIYAALQPLLHTLQQKAAAPAPAPTPVVVPFDAPIDTTSELKKYKELLDTNVITEEEFAAKKKQLLGI